MECKKWLPSAVTLLNLFFGLASILKASTGEYYSAAVMILFAMVLDGIDGRIARWLGASSAFGKELDSLADVISFGAAPAILVYLAVFAESLPVAGVVVAFAFTVSGALRLARFNLSSLPHFEGVPITIAGGLLAAVLLLYQVLPVWFYVGFVLLFSVLMLSRFRVPKL